MALHRIARWSLIIKMLFAVSAAFSQTNIPAPGAGGGKFRAACGEDLHRFCFGVQSGGGRLVQCLSSHTNELSAACGSMIAPASRVSARLRAACGEDLQQFCFGVQPGGGRLVRCLSFHTNELSTAYGTVIAAIDARRGASHPSEQGPATQSTAPVTVGNSPAPIGSILRASCGPDAERLCAWARRENDVLNCLDSRRAELSTTCSSYFQKLDAPPTAQENTPNKKPPSPPPTTPIPIPN